MKACSAIFLVVLTCGALPALGQTPPDYGLTWRTVGAPGNRNTIPSEVPIFPDTSIGAVSYEYRLTQTEITAGQWLQFVLAYAPHSRWSLSDPGLTGDYIQHYGPGPADYTLNPVAANRPIQVGWRYAAIYCNWLCNGEANTTAAFESGAYDINTFTSNPNGSLNDQITPSPGALFWIPSLSEWVKGGYYDPNRYGPGSGGYWRSPNGTNDTLISGLPQDGGQTSAGPSVPPNAAIDVGSYPTVQSPSGLLDISGGAEEWTGSTDGTPPDDHTNRITVGSSLGSSFYTLQDHPEWIDEVLDVRFTAGLRIASVVPAPSAFVLFAIVTLCAQRKRRQCVHSWYSSAS